MMKNNLELLFFMVLIVFFSISSALTFPNIRYFLALILIILPVIYFFKSILRIGNNNDDSGVFYLSVFILLFLIANKYFFSFYDFLISFVVIIFIGITLLFFIKKNIKKELNNVYIFTAFIYVLSFTAIIIPNEMYLIFMQDWDKDFISYRKLSWNDFKGIEEINSEFDATISSEIRYKVNRFSEYAIILHMSRHESSKKNKVIKTDTNLLKHEQGHFDIKKIHFEYMKDSIHSRGKFTEKEFEGLMNYWYNKQSETDSLYDLETDHNRNQKQQRLWNDFINKELENFN